MNILEKNLQKYLKKMDIKRKKLEQKKQDRLNVYLRKKAIKDKKKRLFQAKALKMLKLKQSGLTLEEIGKKYNVSREYIRQVIKHFPEYKNIPRQNRRPRKSRIKFICNQCKKTKMLVPYQVKNRQFCEFNCYMKSIGRKRVYLSSMTKEEKLKYHNERQKKYYNTVLKKRPDWKDKVRKNNQAMKTKKWYRLFLKKKYLEIRNDPVKWQKELERGKIYRKKRNGTKKT